VTHTVAVITLALDPSKVYKGLDNSEIEHRLRFWELRAGDKVLITVT
jgi:hypothetical protein